MRGSPGILLLSARRRGRTAILCLAVIGLVIFTLYHGDQVQRSPRRTKGNDPRLSKYLEYVTPWVKPKATQAPKQPHPGPVTEVEPVPVIPPTLQEDDEYEEEALDLYEEESLYNGLAQHHWRNDGLVDVNPKGGHPIYELVRRAETRWQGKLRRASTTLKQAVREYKRRYKRLPPKGFDHW